MTSLLRALTCASSALAFVAAPLAASTPAPAPHGAAHYHHVVLISIDGMHAGDLDRYITAHPTGTLATLAGHGVRYPNANSSKPSDSFPGLLAMVTGGTPYTTGVWYDVGYGRDFYAPGTNCTGPAGYQPDFSEAADKDLTRADAGGTLGDVTTQIDTTRLPLHLVGGVCTPVWPHDFVKVNTVFEVIKAAGLRTAWADKHPAYDLVNGPSGNGVDDLFTPEVNSNDSVTGGDTTKGFHSVERNDLLKVEAVLNEIAGKSSTGIDGAGVPAILGMNFQAVSVGQKLAKGNKKDADDTGLIGGYADASGTPNNGLALGLDFVDTQLGRIKAALVAANLDSDTLIIISAKHGQSPIDPAARVAVDPAAFDAVPGIDGSVGDDVGLIWLKPSTRTALSYRKVKDYLNAHAADFNTDTLLDKNGLVQQMPRFRNPLADDRAPDFVILPKHGTVYTTGSKLAEHGGFAQDDTNVALLVSAPDIAGAVNVRDVETRQIAPTILRALGIPTNRLQAVVRQNTSALPGTGL